MSEVRQHPDLFTGTEALAYLRVTDGSDRTLETFRRSHGLVGFMVGQEMMYHRRHLDALVERLAGMDLPRRARADESLPPAGRPVSSQIRTAMRV